MGSDEKRVKEAAIPLGRIGQPEDIVLAIVYLASDAADWVTGVTLDVTGGETFGGLKLQKAESYWSKAKKSA